MRIEVQHNTHYGIQAWLINNDNVIIKPYLCTRKKITAVLIVRKNAYNACRTAGANCHQKSIKKNKKKFIKEELSIHETGS